MVIGRWLPLALVWPVVGCASVWEPPISLPAKNTAVREQLVLHSDAPLPAQHRLFDDLTAQRAQVASKLALPTSDEPIHVYLFENAEAFQAFMHLHYPDLPARRAFFVESDTRLAVYAHWGDRVAEDLRHEVAHGYLHAAVPGIPLWLDEGLAEYFEVPRGAGGLNRPHVQELVQRLAAGGWRPDMKRLETLPTTGDMTQLDYAESWAWVHWLLETTPERKDLVRRYLAALRQTGAAAPISGELERHEPTSPQLLAEHVYGLAMPK